MKIFSGRTLLVFGSAFLWGGSLAAAPATHVQTFHPGTQTVVVRPTSSVEVTHPRSSVGEMYPATTGQVAQPATSVAVSQLATAGEVRKPSTTVRVSHPTTTVAVNQPATSVPVTHPGEANWQQETGKYKNTVVSPVDTSAGAGKKAAASMKDSYQPAQAKDFKAAKLGGGDEGLGNKMNQAEKDAAAAALNIPKGEEVSLEHVLKSASNGTNLKQKVGKKL